MLRNYLKIALRNLAKYKAYSMINISGLAIGMACCILILFFVQDELSFDRYHEHADRIYRLVEIVKSDDFGEESSSNAFPVGPALAQEYPHLIEGAVRFFDFQASTLSIEFGDQQFNEPRFFFADSNLFKAFSFSFVQGNPQTALAEPNSVVLTESMARKYFPDSKTAAGYADPLGKLLLFENQHSLKITAVIQDMPANSHFQADFFAAFSSLETIMDGGIPESWYWNPCWTYLLLKENIDPTVLESQLPRFVDKYFPDSIKDIAILYLQPLTDIHLYSHLDYEIEANSDIAYIYIFSGVAVFILLIACINFMNLATARSIKRAREVGMRKMFGAHRLQLIKQFLGESLVFSFIAMFLALMLIEITLPAFNNLAGKAITSAHLLNAWVIGSLFLITLLVGFGAGIYPAFFLSAFQPVKMLKGTGVSLKNGKSGLRSALVISQFVISIVLIVGTIVSYQQLNYLRSEKLGFQKEGLVMLPIFRTAMASQYQTFKDRLLHNRNIISVTAMEDVVGAKFQTNTYRPEGIADDRPIQFPRLIVHNDFVKTLNIEMMHGRGFSQEFPADSTHSVVINETAARFAGWTAEEAIGKKFGTRSTGDVRVVGVMKDFNFTSLHQPLRPFVLDMPNNRGAMAFFIRYIAVRVNMANVDQAVAFLGQTWDDFDTGKAFDFFFLDDELNKLYQAEEKLGDIFVIFSCLAIFIACLGLFALASFTAEQRTKEIGVRKVLGASIANLIALLSKDFVKLVLVANLIAWPLAWFVMNRWLAGFAYRIAVDWLVFLFAGGLALIVALITVSWQAIRAALADPVKALKYE